MPTRRPVLDTSMSPTFKTTDERVSSNPAADYPSSQPSSQQSSRPSTSSQPSRQISKLMLPSNQPSLDDLGSVSVSSVSLINL